MQCNKSSINQQPFACTNLNKMSAIMFKCYGKQGSAPLQLTNDKLGNLWETLFGNTNSSNFHADFRSTCPTTLAVNVSNES